MDREVRHEDGHDEVGEEVEVEDVVVERDHTEGVNMVEDLYELLHT